uniref:CBFD_NFYB_HMF domain-containing protein n=1 Tax=Ascaris lumbricoides TaxID=6252 RepID=A0A0M3HFW4_ASCLU
MKDQLLRLHQLNKPAALRAAADICETIISPTTTPKSSQTVLMKGEKRTEECFIDDEQLMTAIET